MKIGFIGAGRVGKIFGKYLINKGFNVLGYSNRSKENLKEAIKYTNTSEFSNSEIIKNCDVIFVTVNDDNIKDALDKSISNLKDLSNKSILHMSGAHSSKLLKNAFDKGAKIYSLHPLQSFSDLDTGVKNLENTYFSIESYDKKIDKRVKSILEKLHSYFEIESSKKDIYHMAACVFSNYLTTLMDFGLELTSSLDIDKKDAFESMKPLIYGTLKNIENQGIEKSLTGPLARGDVDTINKHLDSFNNENKEFESFYKFLGIKTLDYIKKNEILKDKKISDLNRLLEDKNEKNNN
ncbi:MAG: Rossmann-like and DUF2520 domain-containing protein [Bacillota bacterium]